MTDNLFDQTLRSDRGQHLNVRVDRVFGLLLDIDDDLGGYQSMLSPTEARQLARMLNHAAEIAEGK